MMMFRLWQNALLEKVSPAQLLQPQDAHPPRMFFPLGRGSTGAIALNCDIGLLQRSPCLSWFWKSSRLPYPPLLVTQVLRVAHPLM